MADLIVVTGPPGAGKSTVAALLAKQFDPSSSVNGDAFFAMIDQGYIAPWTTAAHQQNETVIAAAAAAAGQLARGGYTVVYDGVIGPWSRNDFGMATGLAQIHYAVLLPPEHVCLERIQSRSGHGFTDLDAARRMYREFADTPIESRHLITSIEPAADLAAEIVELVADGSITWAPR